MKPFLTILLTTLLAVPAIAMAADTSARTTAPAFELADQDGKVHKLSDYQGKYLVLHWTNSGCPFIKRHFAEHTFNALAQEFAGKGVEFAAVNSSNFITPDAAKHTVTEEKLTYPTLLDPAGTIGKLYGAKTTPHIFIIDPKGAIAYQGAIDDDPDGDKAVTARTNYARTTLQELLAGKPVTVASTKPYGCSVKYAS